MYGSILGDFHILIPVFTSTLCLLILIIRSSIDYFHVLTYFHAIMNNDRMGSKIPFIFTCTKLYNFFHARDIVLFLETLKPSNSPVGGAESLAAMKRHILFIYTFSMPGLP